MEKQSRKPPLPVDHGWAWWIMVGYFINVFIVLFWIRGLAILLPIFLTKYQQSTAMTTLAFGISEVAEGVSQLVISEVVMKKFSVRSIVHFGTAATVTAILSLWLSSNIILLNVAFAVVGFSRGFLLNPQIYLLSVYFKKRLPLASSMASTGLSFATVLSPLLTQFLLITYGLDGTFLIFAGISAHSFIASMLFRPPSMYDMTGVSESDIHKSSSAPPSDTESKSDNELIENVCISKHPKFWGKNSLDRNKLYLSAPDLSSDVHYHRRAISAEYLYSETLHLDSTDGKKSKKPQLMHCHSACSISKCQLCVKARYTFGTAEIKPTTISSDEQYCQVLVENNDKTFLKDQTENDNNEYTRTPLLSDQNPCTNHGQRETDSSGGVRGLSHWSKNTAQTNDFGDYCKCEEITNVLNRKEKFSHPVELQPLHQCCVNCKKQVSGASEELNSNNHVHTDTQEISSSGNVSLPTERRDCCHCCRKIETCSILANPVALLMTLTAVVGIQTHCGNVYMPVLGLENGLSSYQLPWLLTISGISDIIGKALFGLVADKTPIPPIYIACMTQIIAGTVLQFSSFYQGMLPMAAFSVLFGLTAGMVHTLHAPITLQLVGISSLTPIISSYFLGNSLLTFLEHLIIGTIKDSTGSFAGGFHFVGAMNLTSVIFLLLAQWTARRHEKTQDCPQT